MRMIYFRTLLLLISIILGYSLIFISNKGVEVQNQRNTGPEFLVMERNFDIDNFSIPKSEFTSVSEFYAEQDLDKVNGYVDSREAYMILGKYVDFKREYDTGDKIPIIRVKYLVSFSEFRLMNILLVILITIFALTFLMRVIWNRFQYEKKAIVQKT